MTWPNAPFSSTGTGTYRFTFQGQEHDDEINGSPGTSYAFEYRVHDPRVGRFLSMDPLASKYPWNSPYAFSENKVIQYIELEGLETAENHGKQNVDTDLPAASVNLPELEVFGKKPEANFGTGDVDRGAYGSDFKQYKLDCNLPSGMSRHQASNWQKGALHEWNAGFGLPANTPHEGSWDAWYMTTDYYRQDQAQAASGLLLGGYIMAAQLEVLTLGGLPKPHLQTVRSFHLKPRYEPFNSSIDDVMSNPSLLSGRSLNNVQTGLQFDRSSWFESALTRGNHKGQGWKLIDGKNKSMYWHPGGGHHGPNPYWRVSDGANKSGRLPSWGQ